ncbi:MAG: CsbD family protein [Clostridia bacterium]|nr:CsbD family protein [Clostridia bacterium]
MGDFKKDLDHAKNKAAGEAKEAVGKATGNEQLELKGKIQSAKADFKKSLDAGAKMKNAKEKIAGKINDGIDKNKKKKKKKKK